jgi:predicted nucleic acid-binding protein
MDRLSERLRLYPRVGLDTSIFIYHFEENPAYCALTREILSSIERGERQGITSTISLMEIIVQPLSLGRVDIARKYEALLVNFPNLEMIDIDREIIRRAAQLRAKYRIRPPDALQTSTSLVHRAVAFITNDQRLKRLKDELDVIILDDYSTN